MKSEWKISSNYIGGKKLYIAYRLRDVAEVDHSGNREYSGDYTTNRDEAQALVDKLNSEEKRDSK